MSFRELRPGRMALVGMFLLANALHAVAAEPSQTPAPETKQQRDARMAWWREARFGMFVHWGLYAVPAGEWKGQKIPGMGEWILFDANIPFKDYEALQKQFKPTKFDADKWARIAKNAGMGYVVLTTKHIDGFCMFDSKLTDYNVMRTPFKRDVLKELSKAVRGQGMKMCTYYSVTDFHHPDFTLIGPGTTWSKFPARPGDINRYLEYQRGQLRELLTNYGPIGVMWFDACYDFSPQSIRADELMKMMRGIQPNLIVNNRLGTPEDLETPEQGIPATGFPGRDWETCMTINDTWGFKENDHNWKSTETLLRNLIDIVSKGGNYLLNVGPTADGEIPAECVQRLDEIGRWMSVNGAAIHGTTASCFKKLDWGRCTQKPGKLFLHVFDWPKQQLVVPGLRSKVAKAYLLSDPKQEPLAVAPAEDGVAVTLPEQAPDKIASVVVLEIAGPADVAPYAIPQSADRSVTLPAIEATIHGATARYDASPGKENIGYWTNAQDWVDWNLAIKTPGTFEVQVTYACQDSAAGSEYTVEIAGQKLTGKVEATGGWAKFVTKSLGRIEIPAAGRQTLAVRATAMPNGAVMDLRTVLLKPAPAETAAPIPETKQQRDARMAWWRDARFGMFIHWGPYAVPAGTYHDKKVAGLGEWIMYDAKIPVAEYEKYAQQLNPVKFDADQWVAVAKAAGMKYIVITAKHCDGFAMYPSKASKYNIVDATPFKRDPMAELSKACAAQGIRLCFYYSHCWDWHEPNAPGYINDWDFGPLNKRDLDVYFKQKSLPQVEELVATYKPALMWFDVPDLTPQRSREFLNVIRRHVPDCIVNDRVGNGLGDYATPEQFIPPNGFPGQDWETCMTINDTWGFKSYDANFKSTETLLRNLIDIASKNGNYLLNIGPTAEGVIPEPEVQRLKEMGKWLEVNGEAISGTTASPFKKAPLWGRVTQKPGKLFLHVFNWPQGELVVPGLKNKVKQAYLLADAHNNAKAELLEVVASNDGVTLKLPRAAPDKIASVVVLEFEGPADVAPYATPQSPDGSVTLPAADATIHGTAARHDSAQGAENIGFWSNVQDWVDWSVSIKTPGTFEVQITYACQDSDAGSDFTVEVAGQKLTGKVEPTGGWTKFVTKNLGRMQIPAGRQTLAVRATAMPKGAVMDLKAVLLKPASP